MRERPLSNEPRERLRQRVEEFGVFLKPPYTFDTPKGRIDLNDPNKEYDICRNNVLTVVLGRLFFIFNDAGLPLREKDRTALRELHDKIADITKGPDRAAKLRTADEMHTIHLAMDDAFSILKNAAETEPDSYHI